MKYIRNVMSDLESLNPVQPPFQGVDTTERDDQSVSSLIPAQ